MNKKKIRNYRRLGGWVTFIGCLIMMWVACNYEATHLVNLFGLSASIVLCLAGGTVYYCCDKALEEQTGRIK